jgi:hypothetical protein
MFGYLAKRNAGYVQRKLLNLFTEFVEWGCIAWVADVTYIRSLLIIPLIGTLANTLQEYYLQLIRSSPASVYHNKRSILDLVFYGSNLSLMALGVSVILNEKRADSVFLILFALRCSYILMQMILAPSLSRVMAFQRIRPNLLWLWGTSLLASIITITARSFIFEINYLFFVSAIFNLARVIQELTYYLVVKRETQQLRFVFRVDQYFLPSFEQLKDSALIVGCHFLVFWGISLKLHQLHSKVSSIYFFIFITLVDRLIGRVFRSLSIDLIFLSVKDFRLKKQGWINLALMVSLLVFCFLFKGLASTVSNSIFLQIAIGLTLIKSLFGLILVIARKRNNRRSLFALLQLGSLLSFTLPLATWPFLFIITEFLTLTFLLASVYNEEQKYFGRLSAHEAEFLLQNTSQINYSVHFEWWNEPSSLTALDNYLLTNKIPIISINKKSKIGLFSDELQFRDFKNQFPLQVRKHQITIKKIEFSLIYDKQKCIEFEVDKWGRWGHRNGVFILDPDVIYFLWNASRNWLKYPNIGTAGKIYKSESLGIEVGSTDYTGRKLWLKRYPS